MLDVVDAQRARGSRLDCLTGRVEVWYFGIVGAGGRLNRILQSWSGLWIFL